MTGVTAMLAAGGGYGPTTFTVTTVISTYYTNPKTSQTTNWYGAATWLDNWSTAGAGVWPNATEISLYGNFAASASSISLVSSYGSNIPAGYYVVPTANANGVARGTVNTAYTSGATTLGLSTSTIGAFQFAGTATVALSGTTLTVNTVTSGSIQVGMWIYNGTTNICQITAFGTGTGGTGTYTCGAATAALSATTVSGQSQLYVISPLGGVMTPSIPSFNGANILGIWGYDTAATSNLTSNYLVYVAGTQSAGYLSGIKIGSTQLVGSIGTPTVDTYGTLFNFSLTTPATNILTSGASVTLS
jgi:hypothetical protein